MKALILFLLFFANSVQARLLNPSESQLEVAESHSNIHVRKDHLYTNHHKIIYNIVSERARERLSLYTLQFNPDIEDLQLIEAYVKTKDGKKLQVDRNRIQIKDVSNSAKGFSTLKEYRIPIQGLQVGTKLVVETKFVTKKLRLEDFFSRSYYFLSWGFRFKKESLKVTSEIPLHFEVHDPQKRLRIKKSKNSWEVSLKKSGLYYIVDEPKRMNDSLRLPAVLFSSQKKWQGFNKLYHRQMADRLNEPLPKALKKVVKKIKENHSSRWVEQTLKYVLDNYVYLGDWRPVKGAYIPRSLQEILASKYGDCKDFSLLTVRILRELGMNAYPALVYRDYYPRLYHFSAPDVNAFNHMIVALKTESGITHLDPTNLTVFTRNIPSDIDGRYVLNILPEPQGITQTRLILPTENHIQLKYKITKLDLEGRDINIQLDAQVKGLEAHRFMKKLQQETLSEVKKEFLDTFINLKRVKTHKFATFPKSRKIVPKKGLKFSAKMILSTPVVNTSLGRGVVSTRSFYIPNLIDSESFEKQLVADYWINKPLHFAREIVYPIKEVKGSLPDDCIVETDYFSVKTLYQKSKKELIRTDEVRIKKSVLPNKMFQDKEFAEKVQKAQDCTEPVVFVL